MWTAICSALRASGGVDSATSIRPGSDRCWSNVLRIWKLLMLGASQACWTFMLNSTMFRKNCSRFWSWLSPPCTEKARYGAPSLSARLGVSVERGRWPGRTTLNGQSASSSTNACMRWLRPMPVLPAMTAGTQPPLGVTDTTHPSSSAACTEVVPA
jgi:uncharacterized protein YeaC (DUF1315 family)